MKLLTFFVFVSMVTATASSYSQQAKFNLKLNGVTVRQVFQEIEANSEFILLYNEKQLDANRKVDVKADNETVETILNQVFESTQNSYKIYDRQIVILSAKSKASPSIINSETLAEQKKEISGTVKDINGIAIPGASVVVKGTTTGIITDSDGKFTLSVPADAKILVFSFVGMKSQEVTISGRISLSIVLDDETIGLDEVIAIGYGTVKKSDLTGSVTALNADAISLGLSQSPDMALKGKSSGVQITTVSGQPGAGAVVRIRGNSSILGSNEPLYVVDGVPLDGGEAAAGIHGASVSPLTIISPSDIESMEVLKDASSTAIYGSRGANGVILITTKRGKEGAYNANFNMSVGFQNVSHRLELTSPEQWAELWNESMDYKNGGVGKYDLNNLPARTNWQDEIFRTAPVQDYGLSFNGGNEKLHYMLSGGYTSQDGIIMNTDFKRYSIRVNLENKFTKWLTVGVNLSSNRTDSNQADEGSIGGMNTVGLISLASPVIPIYNQDGSYEQYVDVLSKSENPYASLKEIINNDTRNRLVSNIYAEISFLKELKFKTNFATDVADAKAKYYAPSYVAQGRADKGSASIGSNNKLYWNSTNTLTYSNTFNEINSLTAMVGAEWQKDVVERFSARGTGFANDNARFDNLGEATTYNASSGYAAWQMQSYLTRINYSLMNRYSFRNCQ